MLDTLVVDISSYQQGIAPAILRNGGVAGMIIKSSSGLREDPKFQSHYQTCLRDNFHCGVYHWVDPIYNAKQQMDRLLEILEGKKIDFIALDIEQWWNNWGTWWDAITKKISWNLVTRIRPDLISLHAKTCAYYLRSKVNVPVVIYTSYGFVTSYAPQMAEWIGDFDNWVASYYKYPVKTLSWEDLKENYMPIGGSFWIPPGVPKEKIVGWQYTGDVLMLPGTYQDIYLKRPSPTDVNLFNGQWIKKVFGQDYSETPVIEIPKPVVPRLHYKVHEWVWRGLNVRVEPSTSGTKIGSLKAKQNVYLTGKKSGLWVEIHHDNGFAWIHSAYVYKV